MTRPSSAASTVGFQSRALRFAPRRSDWSRATIGRDLSAGLMAVSYTHLTLPTIHVECRSRWSPYH